MTTPERTIHVDFGLRSYDVVIGSGLSARLGEMISRALPSRATRAMFVLDQNIAKRHADRFMEPLEAVGVSCGAIVVRASELQKSLESLESVLCGCTLLSRTDPIIALGGGMVGDLAGFAAATYKRGVPFIQCPTTLLSMVDASVGGKTGVNLLVTGPDGKKKTLLKNYVGAFHQPRLVLADVDTLNSLPDREFRSGLAECLKHGMLGSDLGDPDLFAWTLAHRDAILARDPATLIELIARNVALKARVVTADEFETAPDDVGGRALLNLGHTFGHALETLDADEPEYNPDNPALKHGEAVALGLIAAAACSELAGLAQVGILPQVRAAIAAFGLPTNVGGLPRCAEIIERMRADKKVIGGSTRLILPTRIGSARVVRDVPEATIARAIDAIRNINA
jgi:3-dehydroquinate synthase